MADSPTIFVSYARADKVTANAIVESLKGAGLSVWWDEDIPLGPQWQDVLQQKLSECSAFLLLIGRLGVSGWIHAEVGVALSRHFSRGTMPALPIVPVLLEDAAEKLVPPFLSLFQFHRLDHPRDNAQIAALASALRDDLFRDYRHPAHLQEIERCPFPGLAPFGRKQRAFFLGRHIELLEALERFSQRRPDGRRARWLRIEGNSGVGKSSLLHAGLIPALENGWIELGASDYRLRVLGTLRPGGSPLFALAQILARACGQPTEAIEQRLRKPDFRLAHLFGECLPEDSKQLPLLAINQMEELFTLTRDHDEERRIFDRLLAEAVTDDNLPLYLVTTLRSDFVAQFDCTPNLSAARAQAAQYELAPVSESGLRDIVIRSVQLTGLRYSDSDLPEEIIEEARGEPGALPLVSNLLRLLCEASNNGELQRSQYKQLGGLGGALARSADGLLEQLGSERREQALRLLLALVEPGVNTANTRRSITRRQALASIGGENPGRVLERLSALGGSGHPAERTAARMVLIADAEVDDPMEDRIDLIHETLLRTDPRGKPYWPTLWQRIEKTDFLAVRSRLEQQARAWRRDAKTVPLAKGRELRAFQHHRPGADRDAQAYLDASFKRRKRNRLIGLLGVLPLLLVLEGTVWLYRMQFIDHRNSADWSTVLVRWRNWLGIPALPELVALPPAGVSNCFLMGSPEGTGDVDEHPQHKVCVRPFFISRHEVTFDQYDAFALEHAEQSLTNDAGWDRRKRPVINVNWNEAKTYADWVSARYEGLRCGLPSEAEWEYAARGGTQTPWHWGDDEDEAEKFAWFSDNSKSQTMPVGSRDPNPFELHDMAGNAEEWTADCWHENYENDPPADGSSWQEAGGEDCSSRVLRGGAWFDLPDYLRSAFRVRDGPGDRGSFIGFRLVCRPHGG